ncbi:MAG: PQQ-binding-like beta-propeller repeat protein [Planctomycetota bacterium]
MRGTRLRLPVFAFVVLFSSALFADDANRPFWVSTPSAAEQAIADAKVATASGNIEKAARLLQVVFDEHPRAFIAEGRVRPGRAPTAFVGARQRALEILAGWAQPMRATYEKLFGGIADELLRQALAVQDEDGLRTVILRFEGTRAGLAATLSLADRALQRGHAAEARLLLARVGQMHPDALDGIAGRLRLAARRDHERGGPPPAAGAESDEEAPIPSATESEWPMMGGDARRSRIAGPIRLRPSGRIADPSPLPAYSIPFALDERASDEPIQPERGFGAGRGVRHFEEWRRRWREFAPMQPAIARGNLVYSDGRRVVALNLYTGDELWSYPEKPFPDNKGRTNLNQILAPSIIDGVVYATIEVGVPFRPQFLQGVPITYYIPQRRLVAIDLESGKRLWSHEPAQLAANPADESDELGQRLAKLSIVGPPLVRGNRVYAPAAFSEGIIHTHLLAVDRHTGKPVYATRLSNGQLELNLFGRELNELATTPVAESNGQIIVGTNLGVVTAIDAVLGAPLWARTYDILPIPKTFLWFEAPRRWGDIDNGPPLIVDDKVILTPPDGTHVICYHRRTGRELWRFSARYNDFHFEVRRLHGSDGKRLFLGGDEGVLAIWLEDDPANNRRAMQRDWLARFPDSDLGTGRGVLAEDGLWVPTYGSILHLDPETGNELAGSFERVGIDAGRRVHLTWAAGALVATTAPADSSREPDVLTVRYRREDVLRLAQEGVRRNPEAPESHLAAGDIHLAVGEFEQAARCFRAALERAEKTARPYLAQRARTGLHRALLRKAFLVLEETPDRAAAAFESAFKAAPDAEHEWEARRALEGALGNGADADWRLNNLRQIEKRFGERVIDEAGRTARGWALRRMALIHVKLNDARRAVADLQKLLEADPTGPDARLATDTIRRILVLRGRKPYEPYERRARKLFEATIESGNLDALERGLRMYANAESADEAIITLGRLRLAAGEVEAASSVVQRFLLDRPDSPQVPDALALLFEAYHARQAFGPALAALQRLRRGFPEAQVRRADGARVRAAAWVDAWLEKEPYASLRRSAHRLDLEPPLVERFDLQFDGQYVDVPDLLGQKPPALRDAVVVRLGEEAVAIDARNGRELYRVRVGRPPSGPFVMANGKLIITTDRAVHVFDAGSGRTIAVRAIPEGDEGLRLHEHHGQVFLVSSGRHERHSLRVSALDPDSGRTLWSRSIPRIRNRERHNERAVAVLGDRLVVLSSAAAHITVLDTSSGAIETRVRLLEDGSAHPNLPLITLPDGRILVGYGSSTSGRRSSTYQRSFGIALLDPARSGRDVVAWRYDPPRGARTRYLRHLRVVGKHVVAIERSGAVTVLNLRDGTAVSEHRLTELLDVNTAPLADNQPMHDSMLLLVGRGAGDDPPRLFMLEPPELGQKFAPLELAEDTASRPSVIRSDGVVTVALVPVRGLRVGDGLRFLLVDPMNARRVQMLQPRVGDASWFNGKVQNGILLVTLGNRVVGYGPK